ncbi:NAD(P)-dependent dehydrogenase (short-subunit alcohol dehydrogenase family) [Thermocatellispora tengchongensis]|uniref:NAD(P)-dependent dehydrogenase (Short-subunit alcohol dehydrogenase family) n=1 Tax=Thermocatellispora tengchongensis TaxID=1073253 RepID=A0A840P6J2_9ACTN|nr:SDR family oxidoreductase [Thermocatellispora tengchongensis]MBB5133080.1 NAD(P)-dependent dehydrogenase (short-subunit alcohol dehydrogenase family) [Thermocatellispora tengchongensis]
MADDRKRGGVLVTGATGGIGAATVRALAERGYQVFAGVRGEPGALAKTPGVRVVQMDVTEPESVAAAAKQVDRDVRDHGLRAIVNNAGVIVQGPLELVPVEELRRQFEVNTLGPVYVTQAFLPLIRAGQGRIVNVSAPTARMPLPFLAALSGSKAALDAISTALRLELSSWRIPVVVVEPGTTDTAIFAKAGDASRGSLAVAPPHLVELYRAHIEAVEKTTANQKPGPVDPVARAIVTAVEASSPKRRYVVGDARAIGLVTRLPAGLRDRLVMRTFGLAGVTP